MKVAILGSYPVYPYRDRLKFLYAERPITTYWNVNLARALAKYTDAEVHFFTSAPVLFTQVIEDEGVKIHFVGHPPKITWWNKLTNLRFSKVHFHYLLKKLNPDIVYGIGTDHEYPYIAQTSGYPSVIKVGGVVNRIVEKENYPPFHIYWTLAKFEKRVIRDAKDIITTSNYVRNLFENDTKAKFHVIPNAVEISFFEQKTSEEYDIIYVGRIYRLKRLKNLVMAVRQLVLDGIEPTVIVAGAVGDDLYMKEVEEYIHQNHMESLFRFTGVLSRDKLAEAMAKSKMLVVPSAQETAPMVISEAMAVGKPVVATNVGGIPEMVKDSVTGYVIPPDDIKALADGIKKLLLNDSERQRMGIKAKAEAKRLYHPVSVAQKNLNVFKSVLDRIGSINV